MHIQTKTQIIVIGAGYAGMMATLRLSGKTRGRNVAITLINGTNIFIQRPRLHQVATNQVVPQKPIVEMLRGHAVRFIQGWVTALEPQQGLVTVRMPDGPQQLPYDYLVYALGSVVDRDSVPGVREHAYTLDPHGPRTAPELRAKLREIAGASGQVIVVGSGPTGIEGATEIKGLYPNLRVSLVTQGCFGAFKGERVAQYLRQAFHQQNIPVYEHKRIQEVRVGEIILGDGEIIPGDLILWAGGFRALPLAQEAGLKVNQSGQILTDPLLRSISHPNIYAVGDAAQPVEDPGVKMRMSLLTAVTTAAHVADNLSAVLKGKAPQPFSFAYYGQGIALGPNDAVGFAAFPNDLPVGPIYRGRLAVWIRSFFVWLIFYFLEWERRWPGFYFWLGKGRYRAAKQRAARRQSIPSKLITK